MAGKCIVQINLIRRGGTNDGWLLYHATPIRRYVRILPVVCHRGPDSCVRHPRWRPGVPRAVRLGDIDRGQRARAHRLKRNFLYEEPEFFLRQEPREPATYVAILEAMAAGNTKMTNIANAAGRDTKGTSRYLKNLQRLEFPVRNDGGNPIRVRIQ